MRIYKEIDISDFPAWSGARDTLDRVIEAGKCADLEALLVETEPADGYDEATINDILWFESEWVFNMLGIRDEDEEEEDEEEDEEEEEG